MLKNTGFEFGLCETSCEVNDHLDRGLTNEIIAHFAGEFKATTMRVWLRFHEFARCDSNDNVTIIEERAKKLRTYLDIPPSSSLTTLPKLPTTPAATRTRRCRVGGREEEWHSLFDISVEVESPSRTEELIDFIRKFYNSIVQLQLRLISHFPTLT